MAKSQVQFTKDNEYYTPKEFIDRFGDYDDSFAILSFDQIIKDVPNEDSKFHIDNTISIKRQVIRNSIIRIILQALESKDKEIEKYKSLLQKAYYVINESDKEWRDKIKGIVPNKINRKGTMYWGGITSKRFLEINYSDKGYNSCCQKVKSKINKLLKEEE